MEATPAVEPKLGFFTDRQIREALSENQLLERDTWTECNLRHASYMLRLGPEIRVARAASANATGSREFTIVRASDDEPVVEIRPGDTALLYSLEGLRFPPDVLGFTIARGLLFAEALSPENTYVDPGFSGHIYTTITNISARVVHLRYKMPIARLFFYRLSEAVENGYQSGSTLGIEQQLKSVRVTTTGSLDECRSAANAELLASIRLMPIGGNQIAESLLRSNRKYSYLWAFATVWPAFVMFNNANPWIVEHIGTQLLNVATSVVAGGILLMPRVVKWFGRKKGHGPD